MASQSVEPVQAQLGGSQDSSPIPSDRVGERDVTVGRRSRDYSATRLTNLRLPVDLHDRFKALMREVEERHAWLRKPSLTELVIALLEEGPQTADGVVETIRRKRLDENEQR
jgi:hypothetical protein